MIDWLRRLIHNRHDPAWAPTGIKPALGTFDFTKAQASRKRANDHADQVRKHAAKRSKPVNKKKVAEVWHLPVKRQR